MRTRLLSIIGVLTIIAPVAATAQQPLDLFSDEPALSNDYIRLGSWNLRHINLESGADDFLPGANDQEDFAILIATFGKAIRDLGLDLVAIVEHQPRAGETNRLQEIQAWLQTNTGETWGRDETNIPYDNTTSQFGNLQFGLLWRTAKVTINTNQDQLLTDLRQPRDANDNLLHQRLRAPWLVPVTAGNLEFDLMVLHLKSGGASPQREEVEALAQFIQDRQSVASPRHLIVVGDWNIRPDQHTGRNRLRQLEAPAGSSTLMRVLTIAEIPPTLENWDGLGPIGFSSPIAGLIPFSHFNLSSIDTFLDHIAISRTLDEVYDHPIEVELAAGSTDLRPGIVVPRPQIAERDYLRLTDHLPTILVLRVAAPGTPPPGPGAGLRIVAAVPNPAGSDRQAEAVHITNGGSQLVQLDGWQLRDAANTSWQLEASDGAVQPDQTVIVLRNGRQMALNNSGDTILLINPQGTLVDSKSYESATSGQIIRFEGAPPIDLHPH